MTICCRLLLACAFLSGSAAAHGGAYRVPGPPTGDPAGPTGTGTPGPRGGPTTLSEGPDWRLWWSLNWDRIVDLRARFMLGAAAPNTDGSLGRGPMTGKEKVEKLLPPLLAALKDRDPDVRASAVIALGKIAVREAVEPLTAALKDSSETVRNAAGLALGLCGFPEAAAPLLAAFRSSADRTRAWIAVGLGYLGEQKGLDELLRQLSSLTGKEIADANREVTIACAAGLSVCGQKKLVPEILDLIAKSRGKNPPAHAMLLVALGKLGDRAALPLVVQSLQDRQTVVRSGAASAAGLLGTPGDKDLIEALKTLADGDPHGTVKALALVSLGRIGSEDCKAFLRHKLVEEKRLDLLEMRSFAAIGLALAADRQDSARLAPFLKSGVVAQRGAFGTALAILRDPAAADDVATALLAEKNPSTFADLALAAGLLRADKARKHLLEVLERERRNEFRTSSAVALGLMGEPTALEKVLEILDKTRSSAVLAPLALSTSLFGDPKAVDGLATILARTDIQDPVRALCCVALGNIGDTRRHPALSALSHDYTWMVSTAVLDEMVTLY